MEWDKVKVGEQVFLDDGTIATVRDVNRCRFCRKKISLLDSKESKETPIIILHEIPMCNKFRKSWERSGLTIEAGVTDVQTFKKE